MTYISAKTFRELRVVLDEFHCLLYVHFRRSSVMMGFGYYNHPSTRSNLFIRLVQTYIWIEFPFITSFPNEQTSAADFGICRSSFVALPSIEVHVPQQSELACITQNPAATRARDVCSQLEPYDNNKACIAVYYLSKYNIPLFTAFRMQVTKERPLRGNRYNRKACKRYATSKSKSLWNFKASSTDGQNTIECKTKPGTWEFDAGSFRNQYDRGHMVPIALASRISLAMGAATFNYFNVGPQLKEVNNKLGSFEDKMNMFATDQCLNTGLITGNVVRDFYFITGTSPHLSYGAKWINKKGVNGWTISHRTQESEGSNVPAFFWTAGCCVYKFPDQKDRRFATTVSYLIENRVGATVIPKRLSDLIKDINLLYHRAGPRYKVNNIFGQSACERPYSKQYIINILDKQYGWAPKLIQKRLVQTAMTKLKPKFPLVSDFP